MFRSVPLPASTSGRLLVHSMPGRHEPWEVFVAEAQRANLDAIFCLTSEEEVQSKSPSYALARSTQDLPCAVKDFAIPDFSAPTEAQKNAFRAFVVNIAHELRDGKTCLVHCAGGIGRTGTVVICLLLELGVSMSDARRDVEHAGSHTEAADQESLIVWYSTL